MSFGEPNQPWQRNVMPFQNVGPQQNVYMPAFANNSGFSTGDNPYGSGNVVTPQVSYPQTYNSIGTVSKINSECGLVNDEVFFYRHVCKGQVPKLGDRVLFEATSSTTGQFKWNATRVQLMPPQPLMSTPISGTAFADHIGGNARYVNDYNSPIRERRPSPVPRDRRDDRSFREREQLREKERDRERDRERELKERARERAQRSREREDLERERAVKRRREDIGQSRERVEPLPPRTAVPARKGREDRKDVHASPERNDKEKKDHEREKSRDLSRPRPRYYFRMPKSTLTYDYLSIFDIRQRYPNLYIPSLLFEVTPKWHESFTMEKPFNLHRACQFHIMHDSVEPLTPFKNEELEPNDEDYAFSARVMLLSSPSLTDIYRKCFDSDKESILRLLRFLVGMRGDNTRPMAIGGAWSPSLDGPNPDKDPNVLIRTAIRSCKALTGIDLSNCTQWYRFCELLFINPKNSHVETVVIFLPDVHSCMPTVDEWKTLSNDYKAAAEQKIAQHEKQVLTAIAQASSNAAAGALAEKEADTKKTTATDDAADAVDDTPSNADADPEQADNYSADELLDVSISSSTGEGVTSEAESQHTVGDNIDDNEKANLKPTHYSKLDLKTMKVAEIRNELAARNLPSKRARVRILVARLAKALNTEKEEENKLKNKGAVSKSVATKTTDENVEMKEKNAKVGNNKEENEATNLEDANETKTTENKEEQDKWNEAADDAGGADDVDMNDIMILDEYDSRNNPEDAPPTVKELTEKEKKQLRERYTLPYSPHIIVHPNRAAKNGKFNCYLPPLKQLLDYRIENSNKNRNFEVFLFAEFFKEMLTRDFAFNIYKELYIHAESKGKEAVDLNAKAEGKEKNAVDADGASNNVDADTIKAENKTKNKDPQKASKDASNAPTDTKSEANDSSSQSTVKPANSNKRKEHCNDKKAKTTMVTVKPHLLLSFTFFDTNHCGYVLMRNLSELFSIIGLGLSRAQLQTFCEAITTRQAYDYRSLTDKESTTDSIPIIEDSNEIDMDLVKKIALGNYALDKQFNGTATAESLNEEEELCSETENGLVNYNGTVVHVGKLMDQIQRTEKSVSDLDMLYNELRKQFVDLQKEHSRATNKIKDLNSDVKSLTRKLADANYDLNSTTRKCRDQMTAINSVYRRLEPFIEREKDKDKNNKKHDKDEKNSDSKDKKDKDAAESREERENKNKEKHEATKDDKEKNSGTSTHSKKDKAEKDAQKQNGNENKNYNNSSKKNTEASNQEMESISDELSVTLKSKNVADSDDENADLSNNGDGNNDDEQNEENNDNADDGEENGEK